MKTTYRKGTLRRVPNPLASEKDENGNSVLKDPIRDISEEEFELKLQALEPHERDFAIKYRNRVSF